MVTSVFLPSINGGSPMTSWKPPEVFMGIKHQWWYINVHFGFESGKAWIRSEAYVLHFAQNLGCLGCNERVYSWADQLITGGPHCNCKFGRFQIESTISIAMPHDFFIYFHIVLWNHRCFCRFPKHRSITVDPRHPAPQVPSAVQADRRGEWKHYDPDSSSTWSPRNPQGKPLKNHSPIHHRWDLWMIPLNGKFM